MSAGVSSRPLRAAGHTRSLVLFALAACSSPRDRAPVAPAPPSPPAPAESPAPPVAPDARDAGRPTASPAAPDGDAVVAARAAEAPRLDGVLDDAVWQQAAPNPLATDWRGQPVALETTARLAWRDDALYFAFDCAYAGTLSIDDRVPPTTEHVELYRHDAVEVFLDADPATPATYVELEVGPGGHFLDIDVDRERRPRGDVTWSSGMTLGARVDAPAHRYAIEARVPAAALGRAHLSPGALRVALYRLAGQGEARLYLARFPTMTPRPSFHVPERFGDLVLR